MSGARALIVDDDPDIRLIAELALGRVGGFSCATAASGAAAIDALDAEPFDVVLLDLVLPDLDGAAVLARIRARPALDATPVILMTGRGPDDGRPDAHALGAAGFIAKPFDPLRLPELVREILDGAPA